MAPRSGSALREITDRVCLEAGFPPRVEFECDHLAAVHGFVAAGLGIAITPLLGQPEKAPEAALQFTPLTGVSAAIEIGVTWSLERRLLPAATAFLSHVREGKELHRA